MDNNKVQLDRKIDSAEGSSAEKLRKRETSKEQKELKETTKGLAEQVSGMVETAEVVAESGEVAERMQEDKKTGPTGQIRTGGGQAATATKPIPVVKIPKIEILRTQVAKAIKREIHHLEKQAKKMAKSPTGFQPFTLNGMVAKIRELKEILAMVTYATFETLKGWWLKFVKEARNN